MKEKTVNSKTVFAGRLLNVDVLDVELEMGVRSMREIVRHPGAAVVLAQLPDGQFVFVRQFRKPLEMELIEAVAGTLEPGEDPADCAARELKEETGHNAGELRELGVIFSAPGYTDEKLHVYYSRVHSARSDVSPDEDENLDLVYLAAERVEEMISSGKIMDAKTLAAWLPYQKKVLAP